MFDFLFLATAIVLLSIDFVYLRVMKHYFDGQINRVQGSPIQMNYLGAALCYVFLIIGLYYFVVKPRRSTSDAFLLGIVIYGVYETTNYALFSKWSILTVLIDTAWGGLLFAATNYLVNGLR